MSEQVVDRIKDAIADHGPITFAEFMEHALYGPGGFYERPPVGAEGHFVTSPHVHPVFAELLLRAVRDLWEGLGRPEPLAVVEPGAGDGTLALDMLRLATELGPRLVYTAVERSPGARDALASLPVRVAERLEELEPLDPGVLLANELLDNLPFRRVRMTAHGPVEVRVDADPNGLVQTEVPCDHDLASRMPPLDAGGEAAVPEAALSFVDEVARVLRQGYALLIDYGSVGGSAGQIHGYRKHRVVEDVLARPGSADVTAGVDLAAVAARARAGGLEVAGAVAQADALRALGFERWGALQRDRQAESTAAGARSDAVRIWEGRSRASLLVDPAALGRLRWLLLATPGLPAPTWVREAFAVDALPSSD
ncbi:MAG TPA: SAM-dependent methyltransferase [Actinomycetota bacterium]